MEHLYIVVTVKVVKGYSLLGELLYGNTYKVNYYDDVENILEITVPNYGKVELWAPSSPKAECIFVEPELLVDLSNKEIIYI